jgi:hypothetical protein
MRPPVPEETKQEVIRLWLLGYGRPEIATLVNTSHGTVFNIIEKWENDIGKTEAKAFRELAKSVRAAGLTPAKCAKGLRISDLMTRIGVKEDDFEQFLSETYTKCESRGITPEKIALYIEDLAKFSDNARLPEIEEYLREYNFELMTLNDRKQGLVYDISKLQGQKLQIERDRNELIAKKKEIGKEIEDYHDTIQKLESYGLDMSDFQALAKVIQCLKELGFDTMRIVADIYEVENFNRDKDKKLAGLQEITRKFEDTARIHNSLKSAVVSYQQRLTHLRRI